MSSPKIEGRPDAPGAAKHLSVAMLNGVHTLGVLLTLRGDLHTRFLNWFEKYLIVFVVGGLVAGMAVARFSQTLVDRVDSTVNLFMDLYGFLAPIAIFIILAPSLSRLFSTRSMGAFGLFVVRWYAVRKVLACLWAIAFIAIVFRIPFLPQGSVSLTEGIARDLTVFGHHGRYQPPTSGPCMRRSLSHSSP